MAKQTRLSCWPLGTAVMLDLFSPHRGRLSLSFPIPNPSTSIRPNLYSSQWEKSGLTFGEGHSGSARRVIEGLGSFHQQEMVLHSDAWTTPGTTYIGHYWWCWNGGRGDMLDRKKTIGARELEFEWQDTELKSRKQSIPCNVTLRTIFGHHKIRTWKSTYSEFLWRNEQTAPSRCVLESGSGSNPKNTDGFAFPLPSLAYRILGYRAKMWWTIRNCFWGWNWMEHKFTTKVEAWVVAGDMVPLTREGDNTSEAPESGFESITRNVAGLSHGCRCGGGKRIYLEVAIVQLHVLSVICRWTGMLNVHKGTTDHELNMTQADGFPRGLGGSSWSGDRSDLCWAFHAQFVEAVVCQVQRWKPTIHKSK
ncbi:hypothetical protein C8F04DRAFT_1340334 [Mycena alexandri]|uniref:Uncharacterized protein n=1 Tax=Mycena alexandri TaxID=1745969 RepID=A0AAD6T259_9AGAR|nr:hypothetical protein C8F04DRAFT_1340334 [Mycena alexandri]